MYQFFWVLNIIFDALGFNLTYRLLKRIAWSRIYNAKNHLSYRVLKDVFTALCKTYKLGIISDTWPSIEMRLDYKDVYNCFSYLTYSWYVGAFELNKRIYLYALTKCRVVANRTTFVGDNLNNLNVTATFGITSILYCS